MPDVHSGDAADLLRLKREMAELRDRISRQEGVIAGLKWLMRLHGIPEPLTPDGEPVWRTHQVHEAGNA